MEINVARVFVNKNSQFGNPVGIVLDEGHTLNDGERQKTSTKLGFSETVFIDSLEAIPEVSIYNPQHMVKFAGHAVLGTVYFIQHILGKNIDSIKCSDESVKILLDGDVTYIKAPLSIMPAWNFERLDSPSEVVELTDEKIIQLRHTFIWSWINEKEGTVRARTFAPDWGIPEDQANGSGSMKLASQLNKNLIITHGLGSVIYARPSGSEFAEVGGLVKIMNKITL